MADQPRTVIFLSPDGPEVKEISETYTPTGSQALVRVAYSGINPADIKHRFLGLHSSVAGYDLSGEVIAVGPDSKFKTGNMVFGYNNATPGRPLHQGGHQDYAMTDGDLWHVLPTGALGLQHAAALPVVLSAAADALFNVLKLGLPAAGIGGSKAESILVWGASGSVGCCAVQLAKAAGVDTVFVTASTKHHEKLMELGADFCFDYADPDVVEKIRGCIRQCGKRVLHVFDAVGIGAMDQDDTFEKSSPATALRCVDERDDLKLACVLGPLRDKRWRMCASGRVPRNIPSPFVTDDYAGWIKMEQSVMSWVIQNYGQQFIFPKVTELQGLENVLQAMKQSAERGSAGLEKVVIKHPLLG